MPPAPGPAGAAEGTPEELFARAWSLSEHHPVEAGRLFDEILAGTDPATDPELIGRVHYARARLRHVGGDYDSALSDIRKARSFFVLAGAELMAVRTGIGMASVQIEHGQYGLVVAQLTHLLDTLTTLRIAPEDEMAAATLRGLAHTVMGQACDRLGDHQRALRHFDLAANIYRAAGNDRDRAGLHHERGIAFLNLALHHRALDEFLQGYRAATKLDQPLLAARCLVQVAETHAAMGNIPRALDLLHRLRGPLLGLRSPRVAADWRLAMGGALLRAGLLGQAREYAEKAAATYADLGMHDFQGRAELLLGQVHASRRDLVRARERLTFAERLFSGSGAAHMQARVWLSHARTALWAGDRAAAVPLAEQVVEALERHGDAVRAASARLMLADLTSDPAEAQAHVAAVTETAMGSGVPALRVGLELTRARLDRREGRTEEALDRLRRLQALPSDVAATRGGGELGLALLLEVLDALDELVDLLLEVGTHRAVREAWQWAAWGKARIKDLKWAASDGWVPEVVDELDPDGEPVELILSGLEDYDFEAGRDPLSGATRRHAALPPVPEGPILEYRHQGDDLIAFVIRDGQVDARRTAGGSSRSRELLRAWEAECARLALAHATPGEVDATNLAADVLAELHQLLMAPVRDLLEDIHGEPLLLVAHRHLHAVPFEALSCPDGRKFLECFDVHFASELGGRVPGTVEPSDRPVLVMACADDAAPMIEAEAKVVAAAWPGAEVWSGDTATVPRFLAEAAGRPLVHVAAHGVFESENPYCSGLRLADGWLTARDILATDLRGSTLVLSACSSGLSSEVGRLPTGLAWACLGAGADGVVATLWEVDDAVTLEFMQHFHEAAVDSGGSMHAALEQARAFIARRHPHPYYWAGFRYLESPEADLHQTR